MRRLPVIALLLIHLGCFANPGLPEVRNAFYSVSEEKAESSLLLESIRAARGEPPYLLMAYEGMYHMLAAREFFNPFSKWSSFKKGRDMLDKAIDRDNTNPEMRLLRLSAQINAPSFLGYNNNIEADKRVILEALDKMTDKDLKQRIVRFMAGQGLTAENS